MEAERTPLALALQRNRLQQKHVAEGLSVSKMTVHAWYHGTAQPTGPNLLRLAAFLRQFEPSITPESLLPAQTGAAA